MEIIQRNFFRLLRSGAFADDELLEPMSAFKWRRLYQMVEVQGVADVFLRGVQKHSGEQGLNMPEEILLRAGQDAQKQQSLAELVSRKVGMSMGMLNKRYVKLLDGERHSIDTSVETMDLLRLLVVNEQDFLNHGINMRGIIFLGRYLRKKGDRVDFVKLDNWLLRLHLQRMAQLQGSILISVFDFEPDELPFVHREEACSLQVSRQQREQPGQGYGTGMAFPPDEDGICQQQFCRPASQSQTEFPLPSLCDAGDGEQLF